VQYPNLFNTVRRNSATVAEIFSSRPLNVSFRRNLVAENLQSWQKLVMRLTNICLTDRPDIFKWSLNFSGQFFVISIYQAFIDTNVVPNNSFLWKIKIRLKIKVFIWLLYREAILTKDNVVKRIWHGNIKCCFCDSLETIQHWFFECALAKFIWRVIQITFGLSTPNSIHVFGGWVQRMNDKDRKLLLVGLGAMLWSIWLSQNDIVFNKTSISSYMQVIFRATYWTRTWSVFQKEEHQVFLCLACRLMETLTMDIFVKHGWWSSNKLSF
jgi:hypothetical protein